MISQSPVHTLEHCLSRSSAATQGHATSFNPATRGYAVSRLVSGRVTVQS